MYHSYEVISDQALGVVVKTVNSKIADGFVPIGGIEFGGGVYLQAVAKPMLMTAMMLNTAIHPAKKKGKKKKKAK